MTKALEDFKASIPECQCHCSECCSCEKPIHNIVIDKELMLKMTKEQLHDALSIMRILGAIGRIKVTK